MPSALTSRAIDDHDGRLTIMFAVAPGRVGLALENVAATVIATRSGLPHRQFPFVWRPTFPPPSYTRIPADCDRFTKNAQFTPAVLSTVTPP